MGFRFDASSLMKGLGESRLKTMFAVEKYGQAAAAKLEAEAKQNAPWHDRTALARQTIAGFSDWYGDSMRVGIAGNMEYSPYLEFCNEGKNAILWPTVNGMSAEILEGMSNIL